MALPRYVSRIGRLPEVFDILADHPNGLAVTDLAGRVDVPPAELREDLLAFYTADVEPLMLGLSRPASLEFVGATGVEEDPTTAEIVRISTDGPAQEIGMEYVGATELALIYSAAQALAELEPDNRDLREAIGVLTTAMVGQPGERDALPAAGVGGGPPVVEVLSTAIRERHRVEITYSRAWVEGVIHRVIDPYLLVRTRRGWEVDAGPVDADGGLRTYLVGSIRSVTSTATRFAEPPGLADLLAAQRTTTTVRVRVPHAVRWAAERYAERSVMVAEDDETVTLDLALLPPLADRVGRLLLACGPDAVVVDPARLVAEGPRMAAALLAHHRNDP